MKVLRWSLIFTLGPISALAQTSVGTCDDLPTLIDEDTEVELTSATHVAVVFKAGADLYGAWIPAVVDGRKCPMTISCSSFTEIVVTSGATLTMSSTETETTLENLRVSVESDSTFVSLVPNLTWSKGDNMDDSTELLNVDDDATATFSGDVIFTDDRDSGTGALVTTSGTLTFSGASTFIGSVDGPAIFSEYADITFGGDASFIDNTWTYDGRSYGFLGADGAAIRSLYGTLSFEGAAYFSGNEVVGERSFEFEGIYYMGGQGALFARCSDEESALSFKGEVTFVGNKGLEGVGMYVSGCSVGFESLVTFTDNVGTSESDDSSGGAFSANWDSVVEFQGGLTATGNFARKGGAIFVNDDATVTVTGPVSITGNEARYSGGAIYNAGTIELPYDASVSDNLAVTCPGIFTHGSEAQIEFTGDTTYTGGSEYLCYLGAPTVDDSSPVAGVLEADCDTLLSTASMLGFYHFTVLDSREYSSLNIDAIGDVEFTCSEMLLVFVTGGGELSLTSSADSLTFSKLRFEVLGYTKLILDLPPTTVTGFVRSEFGGTMYVESGSSLDVMDEIIFKGNTFRYLSDYSLDERGGAALYSEGTVMFYGKAYFLENGFYESDGAYSYAPPGGAVYNAGYMEFMKKGTFNDNFIADRSRGGALANFGTLVFNLRSIFRNNSVENGYNDDGEPREGFGGGLYNGGDLATVLFKRVAIFQDNVGGFRSAAVAAVASDELEDGEVAGNKITFESEAKFRDNACETRYPNTGGAGLWVYGFATVEFQDRAVFKRNNATNGAAIMNTGTVSFASADLVTMEGNRAEETCPDIKNYDKDLFDHDYREEFGNISDTDTEWYEGTIILGDEIFVGDESPEICEFA